MFEVLCINGVNSQIKNGVKYPSIIEGQTYTVIDEVMGNTCLHYVLEEVGKEYGYGAFRFIKTSNIDENERVSTNVLSE